MSLIVTRADIQEVYSDLDNLVLALHPDDSDSDLTPEIGRAMQWVQDHASKYIAWENISNQSDYKNAVIYRFLYNTMRDLSGLNPTFVALANNWKWEYDQEMANVRPLLADTTKTAPANGPGYFMR